MVAHLLALRPVGSQSGYDFVNRVYYNRFDPQTFGAYTVGKEANIDMVEHNGGFGNGGPVGFTAGVSTIWGGDIKGNTGLPNQACP